MKGMSRSSSSVKCTASEASSTTPAPVRTVTIACPGVCPPTSVTTTPGATSQDPENRRSRPWASARVSAVTSSASVKCPISGLAAIGEVQKSTSAALTTTVAAGNSPTLPMWS
jgi:hypothetical protein